MTTLPSKRVSERGLLPSYKKAVDDFFAKRLDIDRKQAQRRLDRKQTLQYHPAETRTLTREEYRRIYGI